MIEPREAATALREVGTGASRPGAQRRSTQSGTWPSHLVKLRAAGRLAVVAQLAGLLALSTYQYSRFALTMDFGYSSGAWSAIAHGHLNPWSSLLRAPYWKNNGEFLMWPLALVHHVSSSPLTLLWIQDFAVCMTELVVLGWCLAILGKSKGTSRDLQIAIGVAVIGALVLNPWCYETIIFDFHSEVIAALFLAVSGHALWSGRTRRLWWSGPLTLLSMTIGGVYLFGLGVSAALAGKRTRVGGAIVAAVGLSWFLVLAAVGAVGVEGRISGAYSYLTGASDSRLDVTGILRGIARNPGVVGSLLAHRWQVLFAFLVVVGLIGVFSVWAAGVALVVFVPALLAGSDLFFRTAASFQIWPALPFVLVGTVMLLASPWRRIAGPSVFRARLAVLGIWVVCLVGLAAIVVPVLPRTWIRVSSQAASQLSSAERHIPQGAEVVASGGVVGRFSDHEFTYNYPFNSHAKGTSATVYPIKAPLLAFVFTPRQGIAEAPPTETLAAIRTVRLLGGREVIDEAGVYLLLWSPPRGQSTIALP